MTLNKSRRQWIGSSAKGIGAMLLASSASMFIYGCNVYDDLYNWIGIGIASLNSIVSILKANGIIPAETIVNAVLGALNAVRGAIDEYKSTSPPPVGTIAKIETALKDAVDQFTAFLRSISFSSAAGLFSLIAGLVQIILSTIAGFQNRLPVIAKAANLQISSGLAIAAQTIGVQIVPKQRTVRAFKKDYNAQLDNGPSHDVIVPKSAYLHISLFERLP